MTLTSKRIEELLNIVTDTKISKEEQQKNLRDIKKELLQKSSIEQYKLMLLASKIKFDFAI
jgi:hypothetical protein